MPETYHHFCGIPAKNAELGLHEEAPHKTYIKMLLNSRFEFFKNAKEVEKHSHLNAMCHPGLDSGLGLGDVIREQY